MLIRCSGLRVSWVLVLLALIACWTATGGCAAATRTPAVSIVTDAEPGAPALHGVGKIVTALREKGVTGEQVASTQPAQKQRVAEIRNPLHHRSMPMQWAIRDSNP